MPKLNGYGVLKKLREDLNTANIPFIFLTSNADPDSRCRAMKLGANDYLTKPVNRTELLEAIAKQFQELHSA
jgi:CheY-like chemotaxis protein